MPDNEKEVPEIVEFSFNYDANFYFEMIAVILSAIVAFYCITRAYTLREKFSLFVGIGFVTITIIDFLHAVFSSAAGVT